MTDEVTPATDEEIARWLPPSDIGPMYISVASLIARIRAEQEQIRLLREQFGRDIDSRDNAYAILMADRDRYRERIRELEAEVAEAKKIVAAHQSEENALRAEVARLREALEPFRSGRWGTVKSYVTHGAPTLDRGIEAASELTRLNCAADLALGESKE